MNFSDMKTRIPPTFERREKLVEEIVMPNGNNNTIYLLDLDKNKQPQFKQWFAFNDSQGNGIRCTEDMIAYYFLTTGKKGIIDLKNNFSSYKQIHLELQALIYLDYEDDISNFVKKNNKNQ